MTTENNIHSQAFIEEAFELLTELETSLLEWEENPNDVEIVQKVFRAMHTIKGSGAMFGFDDIASFTHHVETVLDLARDGKIAVTEELIDLILASRDHIKILVDAADTGEKVEEIYSKDLEEALKMLNPNLKEEKKKSSESLPLDGTVPLDASAVDTEKMEGFVTYRIQFRPNKEVFIRGSDPILLLNEIRELGNCNIFAHLENIPPLENYQTDYCYTNWDIILTTQGGINAIRDVFIFIEDDSEITIDLIEEGGRFTEETDYLKLGEILTARGDIEEEELKKVLNAKPQLGEMLVDSGIVPKEQIDSALVEQQHIKEVREKRQQAASMLSIRVPSNKLDQLVDLVGEIVTVQARLSQTSANRNDPELIAISEEVERLTAELRENSMSIRMVPIGSLINKFRRLVRDLSHELGKEVEMIVEGAETELDKTVIEKLNDPLVHLIRNSIDHGIELPDDRENSNKPRKGTILISAIHSGAYVLIKIRDDGAGINPKIIKAKAIEKGLIGPDTDISQSDLFNFIFESGFSTSKKVSNVSGRGVGMDVVRRNIETLRGSVEITSESGKWTEITLKLPLTLAIIDGLLVTIGKNYFIIPLSVIEECVELTKKDILKSHGRETITVREELVPYIRLRERFGINGNQPEIEQVLVGTVNSQRIGLVVDRVVGDHQTVIKGLGRVFKGVNDISGATILGDGTVALIMDINKLLQSAEAEINAKLHASIIN